MTFVNSLDPTILEVFGLEIRYYGLVYVIGFLAAYYLLLKAIEKGFVKGFTKEWVDDYIFYLVIYTLIGARFFHVFIWNPGYYFQNPGEILMIWEGGLSFHGGILGAFLFSWWFTKKHKIDLWELGDLLVLPLSLFLFFGRIANFVNQELVGYATQQPWGVWFTRVDETPVYRHPYQVYAALKNLGVFVILLPLYLKQKLKKGAVFSWFLILYGAGRFLLDFYRVDARFLGLSTGQYLSLVMVVIGGYLLWQSSRN